MTVGKRIKETRKARNVTQKSFSERICVTQSYISRVESDKEIPTDMLLKLISLEFNVSNEWLTAGIGRMDLFMEDDEYSRDSGMQQAVNDTLSHLFKTLAADTSSCSEYEKKMVADILIELKHMLKLKVNYPSQKMIAIEMIRNSLCYSSMFIDTCTSVNRDDGFERKRLEERKQKTIQDYSEFINEVTNVFLGEAKTE